MREIHSAEVEAFDSVLIGLRDELDEMPHRTRAGRNIQTAYHLRQVWDNRR
jgi:hypothetical protein